MLVVFVHGIFSSSGVFETLKGEVARTMGDRVRFAGFDYPYLEPIEANADRLNEFLGATATAGESVAIVAHSMGGLVSRMALLRRSDRPYDVRFLIMLATPNHGAITSAQLHGVAGMVVATARKAPLVYARSRGLDDLTHVNTLFNDLLGEDGKAALGTGGTDYVTIPATRYTRDRAGGPKATNAQSWFLNLLARVGKGDDLLHLACPHDGIVEAASVRMVTDDESDLNERTFYASPPGRAKLGRNANVHIVHPDLRQANHVEVHSIPRVARLVVGLLEAGGIDAWKDALPEEDRVATALHNGEAI